MSAMCPGEASAAKSAASAAMAGSTWLTLHGDLHIWEVSAGLCAPGFFWSEAPGHLAEKYAHFLPFTLHRHAASAEQVAMARLAAVQAEDCGPCVEIAARGALMSGVPRETINAALAGTLEIGVAARALAFGRAIALSLPETDQLGDAIEAEWGRAVRIELTIAAATGRVHPAFKRGLGYAKSCAAQPLQL